MHLHFRKASTEDLPRLLPFAKATFVAAYEHLNDPNYFKIYLREAFNPDNFKLKMENPHSQFWLVERENELIGYFKINFAEAQNDVYDEESLEIERIYIAPNLQGQGIGKKVLKKIERLAIESNKKYTWLAVWERNPKAVKFYEREGYEIFGTHIFMMGPEPHNDFLMKKYIK